MAHDHQVDSVGGKGYCQEQQCDPIDPSAYSDDRGDEGEGISRVPWCRKQLRCRNFLALFINSSALLVILVLAPFFARIKPQGSLGGSTRGIAMQQNRSETPTPTITEIGYNETKPWTLDEDLRIVIPKDMILIKSSLLWCPNAKSGTTTVYNLLWENNFLEKDKRCHNNNPCPTSITRKQLKNWTSTTKPLSFVIVRNPWDRLRSTFVDKILTGKIRPKDQHGRSNMSFSNFTKYVEQHPNNKNLHWKPVSLRCLTGKIGINANKIFEYDYVLKLEDGNLLQKLEELFQRAGIDLPAGVDKQPKNQNSYGHTSTALVDFYREEAAKGNVTMEELIASVGRTYRDDIETFGYSFPLYD